MILAGGRGRRLGHLTSSLPKPMLPVHGRPFLEHLIVLLKNSGFTDFLLLCGYRAEKIRTFFRNGRKWDVHIRYSIEGKPLGTAGAVKQIQRKLDPGRSFLLLNGDTFIKTDFQKAIRFHQDNKADLTMVLTRAHPRNSKKQVGWVFLDRQKRVKGFSEKKTGQRHAWVNAGIYIVHPRVLSRIPAGRTYSLEEDLFPKMVKIRFFGWPVREDFIDIGTRNRFRKAAQYLNPIEGLDD